jgi:hypothetical protein
MAWPLYHIYVGLPGIFFSAICKPLIMRPRGLVEYKPAQRHSGTQVANFQRITSRHESNANPREKKAK